MQILSLKQYERYMPILLSESRKSLCKRRMCGSIVVSQDATVIGRGHNSPAGGEAPRCLNDKSMYHSKVTDKTCCVHAEQRAITDALRCRSDLVRGANLFFCSFDSDGLPLSSGDPYCTICSKISLDVGIAKFILFHQDGWIVYDTDEYNKVSFEYSP